MTSTLIANASRCSAEFRTLFRSRAPQFQMLPAVAVQALEVTSSPNCAISEFVAIVERDMKLAADMIGMANSVMFHGGGPPILRLQQAVVRLGFRQCRNLILSSSTAAVMKKLSLKDEWVRDTLWRHAFQTAVIAMSINNCVNVGFQGEEFAAGLMHDFGRLILAVCYPERLPEIDPLDFDETPETLLRERRVVGIDHCEAGAWLAESSRLPKEFQDVIRWHHEPDKAGLHRRLVSLISLSDALANHLYRHPGVTDFDLHSCQAVRSLEACGVADISRRLTDVLPDVLTSAVHQAQELIGF